MIRSRLKHPKDDSNDTQMLSSTRGGGDGFSTPSDGSASASSGSLPPRRRQDAISLTPARGVGAHPVVVGQYATMRGKNNRHGPVQAATVLPIPLPPQRYDSNRRFRQPLSRKPIGFDGQRSRRHYDGHYDDKEAAMHEYANAPDDTVDERHQRGPVVGVVGAGRRQRRPNREGKRGKRTSGVASKFKDFIVEFLQGSSIHGFVYLAKVGLTWMERMLWFAFICVAIFSIQSLSLRTWERFQNSPMVISMDRNKLVWNTSFPSLTVCPAKRIDELKVEEYVELQSEHFRTQQDKEDFLVFMERLAGLTYDNLETLPMNKTFGIDSENYLDLIYELKWNFDPEISSGTAVRLYIYETLTEFGICHSVNSEVARYNSYESWKNNDWSLLEHGKRVTVHPLDGEIYTQMINMSTAYDVYFHSATDVPSISKQRYTFPQTDYTTVELIALEIYTAEEARAFTAKQRNCRYMYEAENMMTVPIYTFGLCLAECRMFFALKVCGCVPHFYRNRLRNGKLLPVCGFEGIKCIISIKTPNNFNINSAIAKPTELWQLEFPFTVLHRCFSDPKRSRVWFLGANLQWGIIDYPKMQLRRDVLFSFADVLVYIGGLVGFFLGCSALSFTEVIYYFTVRFVRRMFFS